MFEPVRSVLRRHVVGDFHAARATPDSQRSDLPYRADQGANARPLMPCGIQLGGTLMTQKGAWHETLRRR